MTEIRNPKSEIRNPQDRYHRQTLFFQDGQRAQERLNDACVLIVGCGALGTQSAEQLARAGVGRLTLVDRDLVEWTNLQRQIGFDESDARERRPKADALREHLGRVNSQIVVESHTVDYNFVNALELSRDCDLLLDGTDNLPARFLLNDVSYSLKIPWVYAGAIGGEAHAQLFDGRSGPCLRCQLPDLPPAGTLPTCDTHGVVGPAAGVAASWQSALALRYLTTRDAAPLVGRKAILAPWDVEARVATVVADPGCRVCAKGRFDTLDGQASERLTVLCGRKAVQVLPPPGLGADFDLPAAASRLRQLGAIQSFPHFLRFQGDGFLLTLFRDGRAVFDGLTDRDQARSLYARYVGR